MIMTNVVYNISIYTHWLIGKRLFDDALLSWKSILIFNIWNISAENICRCFHGICFMINQYWVRESLLLLNNRPLTLMFTKIYHAMGLQLATVLCRKVPRDGWLCHLVAIAGTTILTPTHLKISAHFSLWCTICERFAVTCLYPS